MNVPTGKLGLPQGGEHQKGATKASMACVAGEDKCQARGDSSWIQLFLERVQHALGLVPLRGGGPRAQLLGPCSEAVEDTSAGTPPAFR